MTLRKFRPALLTAVLVVVCCGESRAGLYSNVLQNPSFELGSTSTNVDGWELFGNAFRYTNLNAHGGIHALDCWGGYWAGHWSGSGARQGYPTQKGEIWEASVWANVIQKLEGLAFSAMKLEFYDANTQLLFDATSAERITAATPTGVWTKLTVKAQATPNIVTVKAVPVHVQSPAWENGAVWFDDCELYLVPSNTIRFAGREWIVADGFGSPGENYYSTNCVSVDSNGWLHMEVKQVNGVWRCPFLEGTTSLGFGEYRWYTGSRVDLLDSNLVAGLFTYAQEAVYNTNQNEVDIEFSRALPGTQTNCLLYTVQPYTIPGNGYQHSMDLTNVLTTHRFIWRPDRIDWQSYYGHTPEPPDTNCFIAGWRFLGRGIPIETNEVPYMNLWLCFTNAPRDTQCLEMIIRDFAFRPFDGFLFTDEFNDGEMSNAWERVGSTVAETNGCLVLTPDPGTNVAGYATLETIHRNERGERYVFSAVLSTVRVTVARAGEDVRPMLWLSVGTNSAVRAAAAAMLQGRYDSGDDTLTFAFFTKINGPGVDGSLQFEGVMTNVAGGLAAGGIDVRIELDEQKFRVAFKDRQGHPVNLATNSGDAEGWHGLSEALAYGYWFVGAQNSDNASQGSVSWDRTAIGIGGQAEPFNLGSAAVDEGAVSFSGSGFFDTRCTVERTTNLFEPFVPWVSNLPVTAASVLFTGQQETAGSAFYRMKLE